MIRTHPEIEAAKLEELDQCLQACVRKVMPPQEWWHDVGRDKSGWPFLMFASWTASYGVGTLEIKAFASASRFHEMLLSSECRGPAAGIVDITGVSNRGVGTGLLLLAERILRLKGVLEVTGRLSPRDLKDHGERLVHFYRKNGYEVELYGESGAIHKRLDP